MTQHGVAVPLDELPLTIDELAAVCAVKREWIIEHIETGVLLNERAGTDPNAYGFGSRDLRRAWRLLEFEHGFDATPELAGLVADMLDEIERLRARLRRAGIDPQ